MHETLYIVIPCFNEEEVLHETANRLEIKMKSMFEQGLISEKSKVIFVDDGSKDSTWKVIKQLHDENKLFSGFSLSRNVGQQKSLYAGLMSAKEDADIVVSMDADLQDDIDVLDEMVNAYYKGNDIVYGVRSARKKDSFVRRFASESFYRFTKMMGIEIVPDHAHYRLMSKRTVEALSEFREVNLFLPYLAPQLGFKNSVVYYERNKRFAGETKYSLRKLFMMATDGITSFSTKPIAMISILVVFSFMAVIAGIIAILVKKITNNAIPSWLIIFTSVWAAGAFQLLAIRVIGEYIGKTFKETKNRPRYIISENLLEKND
jgi:glycosyltransferase involved in cell wall biosynthesis